MVPWSPIFSRLEILVCSAVTMTAVLFGPMPAKAQYLICGDRLLDQDVAEISHYRFVRRSATQYLGAPGTRDTFVAAWATRPQGPLGLRQLKYAVFDSTCTARSHSLVSVSGDVHWVNPGGQLPGGWVENAWQPEHGYVVAGTEGDAATPPRVVLGRFDPAATSAAFTPLPTEPTCTFTGCFLGDPVGALPDMAVAYPRASPLVPCRWVVTFPPLRVVRRCDSGHRALVAYVGRPVWREGGTGDVEGDPSPKEDSDFWAGTSVEFRIIRPNGRMTHHGVIAVVEDPSFDLMAYPEVVWNRRLDLFVVMWEERRRVGPTQTLFLRRSATVDLSGTVRITPFKEVCWDSSGPTVRIPSLLPWQRKPPFLPYFDGLCELFNLATNPLVAINPQGLIVGYSYLWGRPINVNDPHFDGLQWFLPDASNYSAPYPYVDYTPDLEFRNDRGVNIEPVRKVILHDDDDPDPENDIPYGYITIRNIRETSISPNQCRPRLAMLAPDHWSEYADTVTNWVPSAWLSASWRECEDMFPSSISTAKSTAGAIYAIRGGAGMDWELYFSMVAFP